MVYLNSEPIMAVRDIASKVEERFTPVYSEKLGEAKNESEAAPKMVSVGWWITLQQLGISIHYGPSKPSVDPGDAVFIPIYVELKK